MENKELILCALDILEAIKFNNIESIKPLVETCNTLISDNSDDVDIYSLLPAGEIFDDYDNEAYKYFILNINLPNFERLRWNLTIRDLGSDIEETTAFITQTLNNVDELPGYVITSLIYLCIKINRYDLLSDIRNKILTKE
jgi:hypothetical protein